MTVPILTDHFATLAGNYDAVLSDVWGVVHNGVAPTPPACEALTRFREKGGTVVLISNAPRPGAQVRKFLDHLKVPHSAYDAIVTSGDVTRDVVAKRTGQKFYLIGPERDHTIFTGLDIPPFGTPQEAEYVVCTGLFNDEVETPDDYRESLKQLRARNLFMLCANPDVVVERGDKLVYCAGALADAYAEMGGEVYYAGKPYRPLYELALAETEKARAARGLAADVALKRVLAIGDSVRTDIKGANDLGIDCLFVTAGIHAEELGSREDPDLAALGTIFAAAGQMPKAVTRRLVW
ncbi:MAG: TIGR01459 family HAD-type hydrolase [Alphaproteobacteria bacterium]